MNTEEIKYLSQEGRPPCSVPLETPNEKAGNFNWLGGLYAESQWIWTANLTGGAFENNMGRFFLHLPAVYEDQMQFSAPLLFDEPSYRNGSRMSGFVSRVTRELLISYIAQRRRSWYSMTHHALIGSLTARKHGLSAEAIGAKWSRLLDHASHPDTYTRLERAVLRFGEAFATDPKAFSDDDYKELRAALAEENRGRTAEEDRWLLELETARREFARALGRGDNREQAANRAREAVANATAGIGPEESEIILDAQVLELAFVALQFIAVCDTFTALNIPDEEGLADVAAEVVPQEVIAKVNELNRLGGDGLGDIVPPEVELPLEAIAAGRVRVETAPLEGTRIPLESWETNPSIATRDKGLAVGGIMDGSFGWGQGNFAGSGGLVSLVLHHPELARHQPPYSLSLLFNEDQWRNGTQIAGFVDRRLKELAFQKAYRMNRNRYGVEHHSVYLFLEYQSQYGANDPDLDGAEAAAATERATRAYTNAILHIRDHEKYPEHFDDLEMALLSWIGAIVTRPHDAFQWEPALRTALDRRNRGEVEAGVRLLDRDPDLDEAAAHARLVDRQIAELAMIAGQMDGLGRVFSILNTEGEPATQICEGELTAEGIVPKLDEEGRLQLTSFWTNRDRFIDVARSMLPESVLTANELLLNPELAAEVNRRLADGEEEIIVPADTAAKTGEF